jgi:hypothetical protein
MRKFSFLFGSMVVSTMMLNAQNVILSEDFNVEPTNIVLSFPEDVDGEFWANWDEDEIPDNNGEMSAWYWSESSVAIADSVQGGVYMSISWMEGFAEGNRNWLITPGIYLSDDSGELTWKSAPYQTPLWADGYSVWISTTDNSDLSFTEMIAQYGQYLGSNSDTGAVATGDYSLYDFSEGYIHGADGTYIEVDSLDLARNNGVLRPNAVSLAAYAGQTVYIAFVHDSDDDNILFIDDIQVTGNGSLVDMEELAEGETFKVGPNPTSDFITVSYELNDLSDVVFEVFDVSGKKVIEDYKGTQITGAHQFTYDLSGLTAGNYSVVLKTSNGASSTQLVIQK